MMTRHGLFNHVDLAKALLGNGLQDIGTTLAWTWGEVAGGKNQEGN